MSIVPISPSNGDDTTNLQNQINATAQAGNTLQLQPGAYNTNPLNFPSGANVQLLAGVTVTANSGYPSNACMLNIIGSNVTISGAGAANSIFQMRKTEYTSMLYRHCLNINTAGVSNVTVSGCSFNNSGGDGIYVYQATNVTVNNCTCNNNMRQGSSIIGLVNGISYNNCSFTNTVGALPSAGIDIEPNHPPEFLQNIQITNCITSGNAGSGVLISLQNLDSTSQPVSIFVFGHSSTNDGGGVGTSGGWAGYQALNAGPSSTHPDATNAPGYVIFENCSVTTPAYWGAVARFWAANGASLIFKNLTVTNPMVQGPVPQYGGNSAAVAIIGGGGNPGPNGNAHFLGVNVSAPNGKVTYYFDFYDFTSVGNTQGGPRNCQFIPGTLSGATVGTAALPGRWNGSASGPIH